MDLKACPERQVELLAVETVLLVFQAQREREASPSLEYRASLDRRGREETQVVLDSMGPQVDLDLLVLYMELAPKDLWETLVFPDSTANTVSKVLQVLPGPLVQAHPKETGGILGFQVSQAPLAGKESQDSLEIPGFQAALGSKDCEVRPVSAAVLD